MYLDEAGVTHLLESIGTIAAAASWLGLDAVNTTMIVSPYTAGYMKKLAEAGCPWKFGLDDAEQFLAQHGWQGKVVMPGEPEANYGRWQFPVVPRTVPGMPRTFFMHAQRPSS